MPGIDELTTEPTRVMIAGDRAFLRYAPTCLAAIRACTPGEVEVGVVTTGISSADEAWLRQACAGVSLTFLTIDRERLSGLYHRPHLSPLTFARILMADLTSWDRFVYLDIDVIVQADLRQLYQMDMAGAPVAAALRNETSINAGVLLVDAAAWRRENQSQKLLSFVREHRPWNADQEAIEAIFENRILLLDQRWNVAVKLLWDTPARASDRALDEAFALHYVSGFKPWNIGRLLGTQRQ